MSSIGILGGSFNPPHLGHVAMAEAALAQLGLAKVLMVPANEAPHKRIESDPGPEVRFELCEAACTDRDGIEASRVELDRPGPSWTVDTLRAIEADNPGAELALLLGEDMAASLESWRDPEEIVKLARIAWFARSDGGRPAGESAQRIASLIEGLGGAEPLSVAMEPIPISSTQVRERCASGESIDGLVPPAVAELIATLGIYGGRVAA